MLKNRDCDKDYNNYEFFWISKKIVKELKVDIPSGKAQLVWKAAYGWCGWSEIDLFSIFSEFEFVAQNFLI